MFQLQSLLQPLPGHMGLLLQSLLQEAQSWLVLQLRLHRHGIAVPSPCSYSAFMKSWKATGTLVFIGIPKSEINSFSFYSLRRFMPVLAAALQLDPTSGEAVDNWQISQAAPKQEFNTVR